MPKALYFAAWFGAMAVSLILKGITGGVVTPFSLLNMALSTAVGVMFVALVQAYRSRR